MRDNERFLSFLWAISHEWATRLSGAASVFLTVLAFLLALVFPSHWVTLMPAAAAVFCGVHATYEVWRRERQRGNALSAHVRELERALSPALDLVWDPTCLSCSATRTNPAKRTLEIWIRVGVRAVGGRTVQNARIKLKELELPNGSRHRLVLPSPLLVTGDTSLEGQPIGVNPSLDSDHAVHVDLLTQTLRDTTFLFHLAPPQDPVKYFSTFGEYRGILTAEGLDTPTQRFRFSLDFSSGPNPRPAVTIAGDKT